MVFHIFARPEARLINARVLSETVFITSFNGTGSVGRAVRIQSQSLANFIHYELHQICIEKTKIKKKSAWMVHLKNFFTNCSNLLFRCVCDQGFTGQNCESRYYPCSPSPCQNGGQCTQLGTYSFKCTCPKGKKISQAPQTIIAPCFKPSGCLLLQSNERMSNTC